MSTPTRATARPGDLALVEGVRRQLDLLAITYRRTWRGSVISSFVSPLLFVLAMGVILGGFIEGDPERLEGATSYLAFVVPGLVAAHAMQTAVGETSYPIMSAIKWRKTYSAMLATPLTVRHLVAASLLFVLFRLVTTCAVFMLVLTPFGVFETWWGPLLAFCAQVLVGMAFAACVYAFTTRLTSEEGFGMLFRLVIFPLFLFSGAFFPIANLGPVLEWAAHLTPLWHGVNLSRMFALDTVDWGLAVVHVAVLGVMTWVGWRLSVSGLERRLEQ